MKHVMHHQMTWSNPPGSNTAARTTEAPADPKADGLYDTRAKF
jgi:hypothetical protein